MLYEFELPENLDAEDDYCCPESNGRVQKALQIQPHGSGLLLHLKRFGYALNAHKRADVVDFPLILTFGTVEYKFTAMIRHIGETLDNGHYIAYVASTYFHLCDDATIQDVDWIDIANGEAYLLAYVRTDT